MVIINIVFYLMLFAAATLLWFLLAFLFKITGRILYRLWDDARKAMEPDENESNIKENNENNKKEENKKD